MEGDKMVLIAYHMLDSNIGAYLEWLVNELMMTANKIKYKDARLVMFLVNAITHESDSLAYISLESFYFLLSGKSCRV
jgi:ferric iron reductase protein FhuF